MKLEIEDATFQSSLPELLRQHEGKFVLIHRSEIIDIFNDPMSAVSVAYERFHLKPFLVKEVKSAEAPSRCPDIGVESLRKVLHPSQSRKLRAFIEGVKEM